MSNQSFEDHVARIASEYDQTFADRGEMTPRQALEYHLQMLACYWSRLVGFCQNTKTAPDGLIRGGMGACIQVGSERAQRMIGPDHPIHDLWQEYWWRTTIMLHKSPASVELVETAHTAFEACLARLEFDPWKEYRKYWDKDCTK